MGNMQDTGTEDISPLQRVREWLEEARATEPSDPEAAALATCGRDGRPSVRMVLVKAVSEAGASFFTNHGSRKGRELAENPHAALCFHWKSRRRQVRLAGDITPLSAEESDSYFATRPRDSQIGAWASRQSRPMVRPLEFEREIARIAARHALGKIPRPDFWGGFLLTPVEVELWEEGPFRLHRRRFWRKDAGGEWEMSLLYP